MVEKTEKSDQQNTPAPVWSFDELRRQAEEQLQVQPSLHSEASFQHLKNDFEAQQHELQVHQVELLLQNEELQRSNLDLELARDKYQELYNLAPVGYFSLDRDGHILEVNLAGSAQLGLHRQQLLGRRFLLFVDEASRTSLATLLKRLGSGSASGRLELRLLPQGAGGVSTVPLEGQLDAALSSEGEIRLAITDITALKTAQNTILALNDTLEERIASRTVQVQELNEELEMFVQSTMQALDTPLRHISSFAALLKDAPPALTSTSAEAVSERPAPVIPPAQSSYSAALREHYLREVVAAAEHVQVLAGALTEYFKLGRQRARFIPVSLDKVMAEVKKSLATELEGRQVVWEQGKLPTVIGDSRTLQLLFFHLLENALKFSRMRPETRIKISAHENNAEYIISVEDNGIGFNMRQKARLFALFQHLHSPRQFGGLGIGLSIVKRVVLRHGGRVWGEGKEGEGASFWVALPKSAGVRH